MPIEVERLRHKCPSFTTCPMCGAPFRHFMRGQVHRSGLRLLMEKLRAWFWKRPARYVCVICAACKEVVGYEEGE